MSIRWNKLCNTTNETAVKKSMKVHLLDAMLSNPLLKAMPPSRDRLLKVALRMLPAKQEQVVAAREYFESLIELFAYKIGVEKSQVMHALFYTPEHTQAVDRLANCIYKEFEAQRIRLSRSTIKIAMNDWTYTAKSPYCIWRGVKLASVKLEDIEPAILKEWIRLCAIQTRHEWTLAADHAARVQHDQKVEDAVVKGMRNYTTSKKDSMRGVQVVNVKQAAQQTVQA